MSDTAVEPIVEPLDPPAAAAVEAADTEPAAPADAPEAAAPDAPAIDVGAFLQTPEGQQALAEHWSTPAGQQALVQTLESLIPEDEPAVPQVVRPDPFADDYDQQLDSYVEQRFAQLLDERLGPITPAIERMQLTDARTWADEQFSALPEDVRTRSFQSEEDRVAAIFLANTLGQQGAPPDQAFQAATRMLTDRDRRMYEAGLAAARTDLEGGSDVAAEPPAGGPVGIRTEKQPGSVMEAAEAIRARRGF